MKNMTKHEAEEPIARTALFLVVAVAALILINQYQIYEVNKLLNSKSSGTSFFKGFGSNDLSNVDLSESKSTAYSIALLYPLKDMQTVEDTIAVMLPSGTPEYGAELGVSYDDPVAALNLFSRKLYPQIKNDLKQNYPDVWQRYLSLATKPVGISCEYCCGVGPIGIESNGELRCGCSHNPAIQAVVMWLMQNTDMTDAEVLREALVWKSLWFPKNMVGLGNQVATNGASGDLSALDQLGGMVGGC